MPSVPPAAMHPVASASEYLNFFISGTATTPMVTAVATLEPQIAAKPPHAARVAMARPPLSRPSHLFTAQNKSSLIPALTTKLPISKNRLTTA